MPETVTRSEAIAKIATMIAPTHFAMLTTLDEEGHLHSRPMANVQTPFDGDVWFFTGKSSPKVHDIENKPLVNVAFSDPAKQNYVSLAGRAELIVDRQLFEHYWTKAYEAWFPKGLDDPDLSMLRISVESAQYWDSPTSPVAHIAGFIRSKVTGHGGVIGDNGVAEF